MGSGVGLTNDFSQPPPNGLPFLLGSGLPLVNALRHVLAHERVIVASNGLDTKQLVFVILERTELVLEEFLPFRVARKVDVLPLLIRCRLAAELPRRVQLPDEAVAGQKICVRD